jgi:hypothetical protein
MIAEDQSVCHPPSEAPTSIFSQEFKDDDGSTLFIDTPEFEVWMKGLSVGQRMRVQERLAIRHAVKQAENAISLISSDNGKGDYDLDVWDAAAKWQLEFRSIYNYQPYLEHFGYRMADEDNWQESHCTDGPQIDLQVDGHIPRAGHTWYNVRCKLSRLPELAAGGTTIEWVAPRRLVQLRVDLHHRVRDILGSAYDEQFAETRFAKYGGPPGTTARLQAWFGTLASCINKGIAPPSMATLLLVFLQAPVPEGIEVKAGVARLRQSGDSHSNLGGGDSNSNLGSRADSHSNLGGS